jgi:hypothetical protein
VNQLRFQAVFNGLDKELKIVDKKPTQRALRARRLRETRIKEHKCSRCGKNMPQSYNFINCEKCKDEINDHRNKTRRAK